MVILFLDIMYLALAGNHYMTLRSSAIDGQRGGAAVALDVTDELMASR